MREARRAVDLDPLSLATRVGLAGRLFFTRDYEGAIDESIRILEIEPEAALGYYFLGAAYALQDRYDEGIRALERSIDLDPETPALTTALAWVHARAGQREEALAWLAKVDEEGPILKEFALVYGELGDLDRAFEYLDRAYEKDPASLAIMQADPAADALREDPRYAELMERVGLE